MRTKMKICVLCGKKGYEITFLPSLKDPLNKFDFVHKKCLNQYFKKLSYSFTNDSLLKRKEFYKMKNNKTNSKK